STRRNELGKRTDRPSADQLTAACDRVHPVNIPSGAFVNGFTRALERSISTYSFTYVKPLNACRFLRPALIRQGCVGIGGGYIASHVGGITSTASVVTRARP